MNKKTVSDDTVFLFMVGATMSRCGRALHGQTVTNAPQLWPSHNEGKMRTKFKSASHEKNKKRPKVVVYYFSGRSVFSC